MSARERPPKGWQEPAYQPVHDAMHRARDAAEAVGETDLATALNRLYGCWNGGRISEANRDLGEQSRVVLLAAGMGGRRRSPLQEALRTAAVEPTPAAIRAAADEIVRVWTDRPPVTIDAAFAHTLHGVADLHPLAACRLGLEIRRRLTLALPAEESLCAAIAYRLGAPAAGSPEGTAP